MSHTYTHIHIYTHTHSHTKTERAWHLDGVISQVQVPLIFYPEVSCTTLLR